MRTSGEGIAALAAHEGIVPAPYLDSVGVWTYGIGHTKAAGSPDPASLPKGMPGDISAAITYAVEVFRGDLVKYENDVTRAVKVKLHQYEFDALVSFHYNTGGIFKANLTKKLNAGDRAGATKAFMGWKRPPEIIPRRKEEQRLFRDGVYSEKKIAVWRVGANGKLLGTFRTCSQAEFLRLMRGAPEKTAKAPQASSFLEILLGALWGKK